MTSYFNACDVTVANSNHKIFLQFFLLGIVPPTLKKVPPPMDAPLALDAQGRHPVHPSARHCVKLNVGHVFCQIFNREIYGWFACRN